MTVLRAVVKPFMLPMLNAGHHRLLCGSIAGQLIGDHDASGIVTLTNGNQMSPYGEV
jgi:hypothetical protein